MDTRTFDAPAQALTSAGLPRRRMLGSLLAAPLALALAGIVAPDHIAAKKKHKKKGKHKEGKKKKGSGGDDGGGGGGGGGGDDRSQEEKLVDLINDHRAANGQPFLSWGDQLGDAAQGHSDDMAARHYVSHTSPEGEDPKDRIDATGYAADWWGENIYEGGEDAQEAFDWWKNSPGHNANMLSPNYQELGVGRALDDASGKWLWTTLFASPA